MSFNVGKNPLLTEHHGLGPFITRGILRLHDGTRKVWRSRHHRKGLATPELVQAEAIARLLCRSLWQPGSLNWWIGTIFAIGSTCFAMASVCFLFPSLIDISESAINRLYFVGSIPFTLAAWLQLYQAANASIDPARPQQRTRRQLLGWRPHDIGWVSCMLQFIGTLLFNLNTYNAMSTGLSWFEVDLYVWLPNLIGSLLFLASGYLAYVETCHSPWAWRFRSLSWWIAFINLLGCVGFMLSALLAPVFSDVPHPIITKLSVAFTLQGAVCFFAGALLMLPETALREAPLAPSPLTPSPIETIDTQPESRTS